MIYATRDLDISNFPKIRDHFIKYQKVIKNRSQDRGEIQAALKLGKWWVIFAARNKEIFMGEKIISPQRSYSNKFSFNNTNWFSSADVYYITKRDRELNLKYILSLLNSKLYFIWLYYRGKRKGEMLELYYKPLSEIPIKKISLEEQNPFINLADQILTAKKANPEADTTALEAEIDQLVYELYDLTEEEIAIVESSIRN